MAVVVVVVVVFFFSFYRCSNNQFYCIVKNMRYDIYRLNVEKIFIVPSHIFIMPYFIVLLSL